jgi:hypothetical protein
MITPYADINTIMPQSAIRHILCTVTRPRINRVALLLSILIFAVQTAHSGTIIIPMDTKQTDHLKAYGVAYWVLTRGVSVDWLLNYRGGSFAFIYDKSFESECEIRGVKYEILPDVQYQAILKEIANPEVNMDIVKLEKAPKVAVYSPKSKLPWDDAVTLVLTYAEIPYDVVYDDEVLSEKLPLYDWLHLHHEDFTGQYGRFYAAFAQTEWYQNDVKYQESTAAKWGFKKVSELKLAVAKKIEAFVTGGGFMFAMCSATDSYDISLAAEGVDICAHQFDYDDADPNAQQRIDFTKCFAFEKFLLDMNPMNYEFSNIDATNTRNRYVSFKDDYFSLFEFSAKWDPVPSMLCQNHTTTIKGFMGQTTAFKKEVIKSSVTIMGDCKPANEARYIHGTHGFGTWTFFGGHDPEDYEHRVGDPPTDLSLHPNSPGYRLILNNVLFPAAKKKKQKT